MKLTLSTKLAFLALAFFLTMIAFFSFNISAKASAPSGLQATIATTSAPVVTSTATIVIATSTCSARVISTQGSAVMLTFSDYAGQSPTATFGVLQPASTSVAYDSGQYGCGLVKAYSFSTQNITVVDAR